MKLNLNTLLLVIAALGAVGPDILGASVWMTSTGVHWLVPVAHVVALIAATCAGLARVLPKLRPILAALNLATAPGVAAPMPAAPTQPASEATTTPSTPAAIAQAITEAAKRDPSKGISDTRLMFAIGIAAGLLCLGLAMRQACAEPATSQLGTCLDAANQWCVQPATAVGWQLNLRTGDLRNAAVLVGYSVVHHAGFAVGAGLYGGMGVSSDGPNAPQADLIVSLANFGGVGIGAQRAKFADGVVAYQAVLGVYGNLNFGGTPRYVQAAAQKP